MGWVGLGYAVGDGAPVGDADPVGAAVGLAVAVPEDSEEPPPRPKISHHRKARITRSTSSTTIRRRQ